MKRGGCNSFREPTTVQLIYKKRKQARFNSVTSPPPVHSYPESSTLIRLHVPISFLLIPSRLDCFARVVGLTPHLCCRLHCLPTGDQHNLLLIYLLPPAINPRIKETARKTGPKRRYILPACPFPASLCPLSGVGPVSYSPTIYTVITEIELPLLICCL
jgi:hypothetical protein